VVGGHEPAREEARLVILMRVRVMGVGSLEAGGAGAGAGVGSGVGHSETPGFSVAA
jgi:hypothetical protein